MAWNNGGHKFNGNDNGNGTGAGGGGEVEGNPHADNKMDDDLSDLALPFPTRLLKQNTGFDGHLKLAGLAVALGSGKDDVNKGYDGSGKKKASNASLPGAHPPPWPS